MVVIEAHSFQAYFSTVWLVNLVNVCLYPRTKKQFGAQGTANLVYIQSGPTPDNKINLPMHMSSMEFDSVSSVLHYINITSIIDLKLRQSRWIYVFLNAIMINIKYLFQYLWRKENCFPNMGTHFWPKSFSDSNPCKGDFPFIAMYNDFGQLIAFNFLIYTGMESPR